MTHDEALQKQRTGVGWSIAPVLIVILGDGRRQWATVQGAHTFGRDQSHLTDGLANTAMLMHLAAGALGLGSQHVTIHIQEPFKRVLGVPDLLTFSLIMPIGYPAVPPKEGVRRPLDDMVHHERFDMAKYMTNEQVLALSARAARKDRAGLQPLLCGASARRSRRRGRRQAIADSGRGVREYVAGEQPPTGKRTGGKPSASVSMPNLSVGSNVRDAGTGWLPV